MSAVAVRSAPSIGDLHRLYRDTRDPQARERLFDHYQGLAMTVASRLCRNRGEREDVRQVAAMGLLKALDRFDPDRGFQFSTFAWSTMQGEVRRHFRDHTWAIHVPRRDQELYLRTCGAIEELTQDLGRSPTFAEIGAVTGDPIERVAEALEVQACVNMASLDTPAGGDEDRGGRDIASADDDLERAEARRVLGPLLELLPVRQQQIVHWRFVDGLTQGEIAGRLGISQMHVSRLLSRSLALMREAAQRPAAREVS